MTVLTIARNTFRENIRDKILYNLIIYALLMILSSIALGQLTLGHEAKVIVDLGLSSISIFGTLIAIFIGISLVYKELEKRTVYSLLAKPIHRWEFIVGKYLGLLFTLTVNIVIMTMGLMLTILYHGAMGPQTYLRLLLAICLTLFSLIVTTALALVFSTFSTPALSAVFTFFLWVSGHFSTELLDFGNLAKSAMLKWITRVLYYMLPNVSDFKIVGSVNVIQSVAYSQPIPAGAVAWAMVYGLVYSGVLLIIAILIFSRRDFK